MSVLFLPPSAGAASVPDASETVKGIIRIATSAEATAGTDDLTSMTPAKVKSVVDAAVAGGVTYKGTFDAAAPLDLSNAVQGDLYIIDGAGTYQGKTWAVGDHLLVNADMGGTVDPAKIDKIDSTDSVTSVAGRTGAVVLSTADISGLATVATSGAYSDLSGTPTLATVATTGAYSDLTGTPTLGTAAALDVGTSANNVVQLDGTAKLPAVDGSQLTDLPSDVRSITSNFSITISAPTSPEFIAVRIQPVGVGQTVTLPATGAGVNGSTVMIANDNANYSVTVQSAGGSLYFRNISGSITLEPNQTLTVSAILGAWFVTDFNYLNLSVSSPANGEALVYNSTSGLWENNTVSASVAALDDIGDVDTTGVSTNNVLKYDGANWVDGSVAYSEVTGTPTLATVATSGAYSDLTGTPSLATVATTGAYSDLSGTPDVPDFQTITVGSNTTLSTSLEDGCYLIMFTATATATIPAYPTGKSLVFRFVNFGVGACTVQQASGGNRLYEFGDSGITGVNSITIGSGVTRTFHLWASGSTVSTNIWSEASPSSTSASVAALDDIGDVDTTGVSTNNVLKYDGANWVDGSVAYSEVTGKPSFATIATTGDYSDLNDSVVLQEFNATATASAISSNALHVFRFYGAGGFTLSLSTSTALNGFALFNNISGSDVTVNGGTFRANGEGSSGGSSSITVKAGERRLYYVEAGSVYLEANSTLIEHNADVNISSPANGEALIYNSTSGDWENGTVSATVAALNDIGDVSAAAPNNGDVIAYNSTSGDWEAAAQSVSAPSVTVSSPSADQTLSAPTGVEEAYIYTPSAAITVNLVAAATCGSGFKYQIKNRSTNAITIDPNGSETIDGSTTFSLSTQEASVTLITDGSNWFII